MKQSLLSPLRSLLGHRSTNILRRRVRRVAGFMVAGALCGCALLQSTSSPSTPNRKWIPSGVLALSRPVPDVGANHSSTPSMLGFMPNKHSSSVASLVVERSSESLYLILSPDEQVRISAQGIADVAPGVYSLALKQTEPVWYAPAKYFELRGLQVPGEGAKERFRRGALGSRALFLDGETPIHEGPLGSEEIGGVRLSPEDMAILFDALQVGARVEVR